MVFGVYIDKRRYFATVFPSFFYKKNPIILLRIMGLCVVIITVFIASTPFFIYQLSYNRLYLKH
ncbi:hypothetical protein KsCSTR_14230 [Candidatus Kuenenia stuttgartiensis]|uniref:Uncharacterized protein n=1 Tax=Kuenenia stuttgartiensis TaxID=174633 RepID=Q1Q192_KUEST|nr:hypothetical protein KsCSTR_14230 [Candidatus Kuenenia stuttgartiensis]CAJ73774.1 unknown protein [Candidatus Kuenenia stuttgartiensis]